MVSAWNHAKDMVTINPLTASFYILTSHDTFSLNAIALMCYKQFVKLSSAISLGDWF